MNTDLNTDIQRATEYTTIHFNSVVHYHESCKANLTITNLETMHYHLLRVLRGLRQLEKLLRHESQNGGSDVALPENKQTNQ